MHGGEQGTTEDAGHAEHVKGVHQHIVLGLEHQHEVEGAGDAERHAVGEGALPDRVDRQHGAGGGHRSGIGDGDPGAHPQA